MVNILDINYEKVYLEEFSAITLHLNEVKRKVLLGLLKYFEGSFFGALGQLDTESISI